MWEKLKFFILILSKHQGICLGNTGKKLVHTASPEKEREGEGSRVGREGEGMGEKERKREKGVNFVAQQNH